MMTVMAAMSLATVAVVAMAKTMMAWQQQHRQWQ